MTDIAKCSNEKCTNKKNCKRFMCESDPFWQSYGNFAPDENGKCLFYWPFECNECGEKGNHKESCKRLLDD